MRSKIPMSTEMLKCFSPEPDKLHPLTISQLNQMDGKPVWVEFEDGSGGLWGIVHISIFNQICFPSGLYCTIGEPYYGKTYRAYAYHRSPTIGRWIKLSGCDVCDQCGYNTGKHEQGKNFCPNCGADMREETNCE